MSGEKEKIFVYGSLMGGYWLAEELKTYQFLATLGNGYTRGKLYDFGDYPIAVPADDPNAFIYGELYEIVNPEALQMIDEAEGCIGEEPRDYLFRREMVEVTMSNGTTTLAWIYFYNQPFGEAPLIESGNYKLHMAEKKKLSRRGFFTRLFPKTGGG
jgi:gamma-glutamylcyclotransferase (GGCT)/AIG2-like uncharacterized protein YtfP